MSILFPQISAMNCHHRFFTLDSFFESAAANGFKGVEIWTSPQHFFMDYVTNDPVGRLKRLEREFGIKVIGICPEQTNPKPNNMAASGENMKSRVFRYFKRSIDIACEIEAHQVVVTSGWAFYDEQKDAAYARSVEMLGRIAGYAETNGMKLAIEALQPRESVLVNTAMDLKQLLSDVGSPALKVCLDTGAMSRAGDSVEDYFRLLGQDIIHAHFVDVDLNTMTTHLALGDGTRDIVTDISDFINNSYEGFLSVEATASRYFRNPKAADAQSIKTYREALLRLA